MEKEKNNGFNTIFKRLESRFILLIKLWAKHLEVPGSNDRDLFLHLYPMKDYLKNSGNFVYIRIETGIITSIKFFYRPGITGKQIFYKWR